MKSTENKKEVLRERLDEVKKQLIANSKDAHWAKNAIDELISLKGQIEHEPTYVYIPLKDVEKSFKGETFELCVTRDGKAIYHTYGGFTAVANPNLVSLSGTVNAYIDALNGDVELSDEDKENLDIDLSAFAYIMQLPTFAFADLEFKYQTASNIVEYLRKTADTLIEEPLRDETKEDLEDNERFKDATLALQELNEEIKKAETR